MEHRVERVGVDAPFLEVAQSVVELLTGCKRIGFVSLLVGCERLVLLCLGFVGVNLATAHTLSKSAHKLAMRCRALFIELREDAHTVVCRFGRCLANVGRWRTASRRIEPECFAATLGQSFEAVGLAGFMRYNRALRVRHWLCCLLGGVGRNGRRRIIGEARRRSQTGNLLFVHRLLGLKRTALGSQRLLFIAQHGSTSLLVGIHGLPLVVKLRRLWANNASLESLLQLSFLGAQVFKIGAHALQPRLVVAQVSRITIKHARLSGDVIDVALCLLWFVRTKSRKLILGHTCGQRLGSRKLLCGDFMLLATLGVRIECRPLLVEVIERRGIERPRLSKVFVSKQRRVCRALGALRHGLRFWRRLGSEPQETAHGLARVRIFGGRIGQRACGNSAHALHGLGHIALSLGALRIGHQRADGGLDELRLGHIGAQRLLAFLLGLLGLGSLGALFFGLLPFKLALLLLLLSEREVCRLLLLLR